MQLLVIVQCIQLEWDPHRFHNRTIEYKNTKRKHEFTKSLCKRGGKRHASPRVSRPQWHNSVFKLLIHSKIRDITVIPETSWSHCGGISVVPLINQTSAASRKCCRTGLPSGILCRAAPPTHVLHVYLRHIWFEVSVSVADSPPGNPILCLWREKILAVFKSL